MISQSQRTRLQLSNLPTISSDALDINVPLTACIGKAFYNMHWDILEGKHSYYILHGGRGSLKSSVTAIEIVLGIMNNEDTNAVCYRKVGDTLRDSVFSQIEWAIDKLNVSADWHCTVSPMRCTYKPTGQMILFKGLDKAAKSKSIKVSRGYIKYLWFEELDEFSGAQEIRKVEQSVIRGGDSFCVFKTYNPPKSITNWVNRYTDEQRLKHDVFVSSSDYTQSPPQWLGQQFIDDAEWMKQTNEELYNHEYLGIITGSGNNVFNNITGEQLSSEFICTFDNIYHGVDWGWYPDPFRWIKCYYNSNQRILYLYDEYSCNKQSNREVFEYLQEVKGVTADDYITADSAEPKSCNDFKMWGFNCRGAVKGPNSIHEGIKWLQSLTKIVIDTVRCPKAYEEFRDYEYELTRDGEPITAYPDENNHSIDAVRYAMERVWKRRGN